MIAALNILVISVIAWQMRKHQSRSLTPFFWPALAAKLLAGIAVGLVYRYYYVTGDTFILFDHAKTAADAFFQRPSEYFEFLWDSGADWKGNLRSTFLVKILSVFSIMSNNNYWVTSMWLSLIIFASSWYLVTVLATFFPTRLLAAVVALLFFPSVVFWGAGIMKESLALAGLFFLAAIYIKLMSDVRPSAIEILLAFPCAWVLWNLKYYWAAVFLLIAVVSLLIHFTLKGKTSWWKIASWAALFLLTGFGMSLLHPNFNLVYFPEVLFQNHQAFIPVSADRNMIHYYQLEPTWWSILANAPWALVSGMFRPFIWEAANVAGFVAAAENFIILFLVITAIRKPVSLPHWLLLGSVIVYSCVLCIFLSLSTPNLGSLARYKVGFTPFLIFVLLSANPFVERIFSSLTADRKTV